jgi:LmbE family N-acetylglucosaminyl deacetylase
MQAKGTGTMLVIGHPGHEIRCHGWLGRNRPTVVVLTSGGGASKSGRIARTRRIIESAGASASRLFGNFSDHEIYHFMLSRSAAPLVSWTAELAGLIREEQPAVILTDMVEGYNSGHDLTAYLVAAALEKAGPTPRGPSQVICQPLVGPPDQAWGGRLRPCLSIALTDEEFELKMRSAGDYAELAAEVAGALRENPAEAFRKECFYRPEEARLLETLPQDPPFYETFGERQVASGKFAEVIRHREHVLPLMRDIRRELGLTLG